MVVVVVMVMVACTVAARAVVGWSVPVLRARWSVPPLLRLLLPLLLLPLLLLPLLLA